MCLCLERHYLSRLLESAGRSELDEQVRECIPDPLPIAGISTAESSGQAFDKGSAEALHAEQRGLKFVRCHGVGAVVCALEVYRILDGLNPLLRLLTLQEKMKPQRACP
jgi:hypothetical protein